MDFFFFLANVEYQVSKNFQQYANNFSAIHLFLKMGVTIITHQKSKLGEKTNKLAICRDLIILPLQFTPAPFFFFNMSSLTFKNRQNAIIKKQQKHEMFGVFFLKDVKKQLHR